MSTAKRIVKNTFYLYGKIAITSVCLILSTRYTLQALGIEDFGIYNLICSTVVMLSFLNESMTAATQRFMSYAEGEGRLDKSIKIFNSSYVVHIGISFLVATIFLLIMPIVFGDYLIIPQERIFAAKIIYLFAILSTCMNIMTVPYNAVLIAHENMLYYSIIGSLDGILKLLVAVGTIYIPCDKLISYAGMLLLIGLLNFIIVRIYCRRYSECKTDFRNHVDIVTIKDMFSFAMWQLAYSASSILSIQGMSLILNSFFGTIMNAAQGIARQVCGQMMTLSGTMMSSLNPVIVKTAGAKDSKTMVRVVMTGSKLSFFLVVIIAVPVMFEMSFLLNIWLTEVPDYAMQFCRWEIIQQIIASFTVSLVTMIAGVGDIRNFQLFSAFTYILRLPLIYLVFYLGGIPVMGYYIATLGVILLCIGRIYYAHTKCNLPVLRYISKVILPCLLVSVLMISSAIIVTNNMEESWSRFTITLCTSIITCLIGGYLIALDASERSQIVEIVKGFKK